MAYERKNNTGSLFKNDKMTKETSPPYKGTVLIDGVEYWQSAWVKEANGKRFFSQSFTRKDGGPTQMENTSERIDDEVPF